MLNKGLLSHHANSIARLKLKFLTNGLHKSLDRVIDLQLREVVGTGKKIQDLVITDDTANCSLGLWRIGCLKWYISTNSLSENITATTLYHFVQTSQHSKKSRHW